MKAIHLIEKENLFTQLSRVPPRYESGYWNVSVETADELKGGNIYFHKKQAELSFFGGAIFDFRVQDQGEYKGRIVFLFEFNPQCRGVSAGGNWNVEKKIVV
jgi:hypothetical protein